MRVYLLLLLFPLASLGIAAPLPPAQQAAPPASRAPRDAAELERRAMILLREGYQLRDEGGAGSLRASLAKTEQAYALYLRTGNKTYQGLALLGMARAAFDLGEMGKALTSYHELLRLYEAGANRYGAAVTLASTGDVYEVLGERERALASYRKADALLGADTERREKARVLYKIGRLEEQLRDRAAAAASYQQALAVFGDLAERSAEGRLYLEVGEIHEALGDGPKALFYFRKALEVFRGLGYFRREEAATLVKLAAVLAAQKAEAEALNHYRQALHIQGETGDLVAQADTLGKIMAAYLRGGKDSLAVWYGKQAVSLYQSLRADFRRLDQESHKSFVRNVESHYRRLADTLIRQGRLAEALQVLVLFKDQNFFDLFQAAAPAAAQPGRLVFNGREGKLASAYEESSRAAEQAGDRLNLLKLSIGDGVPSPAQMEEEKLLESKLRDAAGALGRTLARVEAELSAARPDALETTNELEEMKAALRDLKASAGENAVALYTLLTEDDYHVLLVTPGGIKAASRPGRAAVIKRSAIQLSNLLRSPEFDPRWKAKELYEEIFKPLEAELGVLRPDTLLWSLDATLRYVPVAALFDGERYLLERYRHVVFTRSDRGRLTAAPRVPWVSARGMGVTQTRTVEVLGDKISFPALPGVGWELEGIFGHRETGAGGILRGGFVLDRDFTAGALKAVGQQNVQVVHIASHFRFLPGDEDASFLLLGDGSTFSLAEMQATPGLFAGVEMVVLSACETAAQQADAAGREVDGLSEVAQRLGAGSVIATLWPISDVETPTLMIEFYRLRQSQSAATKAGALQMSQLKQLRRGADAAARPAPNCAPGNRPESVSRERRSPYPQDAPCAHPYYWAGFVLVGNGR